MGFIGIHLLVTFTVLMMKEKCTLKKWQGFKGLTGDLSNDALKEKMEAAKEVINLHMDCKGTYCSRTRRSAALSLKRIVQEIEERAGKLGYKVSDLPVQNITMSKGVKKLYRLK